jgi:hypothetical protein
MDQHCCDLLDGIVVTMYYYWIYMEITSSVEGVSWAGVSTSNVGGDCQLDG